MKPEARNTVLKAIPYGLHAIGVRHGEERNAFTANWVMQCSFEPPMLAVAVENEGKSIGMIRGSGVLSVNIFGADQRRQAGRLARSAGRAPQKLEEMQYRDGSTGAPVLPETLGYVECRVVAELASGDHTIFVGEVVDAGVFREGQPLEIHAAGFTYGG